MQMRHLSKVKSLTIVSIGVLEKDRASNGKEVMRGSNASSRLMEDSSSRKLSDQFCICMDSFGVWELICKD